MSPFDLLRDYPHLAIHDLAITPDLVCVAADSTAPRTPCPTCGTSSDRVHSRYTRTFADLPWQGRRVALRVTVRRFRCGQAGCEHVIFCERLPAFLAAHARTPERRPNPRQQVVTGHRERRRQRYEEAGRLHDQGQSIRAIARALRMSPNTIIGYLRTGHVADWRPGRTAPSQLDPYRGHIDRRVGGGCCNARVLHRELRGLGYTGGYGQVRRAIRRRTDRDGRSRAGGPIRVRAEIPSARRLSFEVVRRPGEREE